jgi:hypothetical protein
MREIRPSGSEGGGAVNTALPTPIKEPTARSGSIQKRCRHRTPKSQPPDLVQSTLMRQVVNKLKEDCDYAFYR